MSAITHITQRVRRALVLHWLHSRHAQLVEGITHIEAAMRADEAVVQAMRMELRQVTQRLDAALAPPPAAAPQPSDIFRSPL